MPLQENKLTESVGVCVVKDLLQQLTTSRRGLSNQQVPACQKDWEAGRCSSHRAVYLSTSDSYSPTPWSWGHIRPQGAQFWCHNRERSNLPDSEGRQAQVLFLTPSDVQAPVRRGYPPWRGNLLVVAPSRTVLADLPRGVSPSILEKGRGGRETNGEGWAERKQTSSCTCMKFNQ